ncbi:hypothetical protein DFH06DRAFT_1172470 [Mycena polygramma]|nr:hypothetical protein DFH06DRAFT_1172470 [Mycena polygramma]
MINLVFSSLEAIGSFGRLLFGFLLGFGQVYCSATSLLEAAGHAALLLPGSLRFFPLPDMMRRRMMMSSRVEMIHEACDRDSRIHKNREVAKSPVPILLPVQSQSGLDS